MKLNELKDLIETSATNQRVANGQTSTLNDYFKACDDLRENKILLGELSRQGKLDVSIELLGELLEEYFKAKNEEEYSKAINKKFVKANLTYSQYTDEKDLHPYDDVDICVHNANAVGVLTLISKCNGKITKQFYEVFDSKAPLTGNNASTIKCDKKSNIYYIEDFENVSILDLVPSANNPYIANRNQLIKENPDIINVFYKALEQTQQNKSTQRRRLIVQMMEGRGLDVTQPNYVTAALKLMEKQEQEGFEY